MGNLDRLALLQRQSDELFSRIENAENEEAEGRAWKALEEWQARFDDELAELLAWVDKIYGA